MRCIYACCYVVPARQQISPAPPAFAKYHHEAFRGLPPSGAMRAADSCPLHVYPRRGREGCAPTTAARRGRATSTRCAHALPGTAALTARFERAHRRPRGLRKRRLIRRNPIKLRTRCCWSAAATATVIAAPEFAPATAAGRGWRARAEAARTSAVAMACALP